MLSDPAARRCNGRAGACDGRPAWLVEIAVPQYLLSAASIRERTMPKALRKPVPPFKPKIRQRHLTLCLLREHIKTIEDALDPKRDGRH
jgi:hypothetical protein